MKVLKEEQVVESVGLSRVSIWRMEREGKFPKRLQLGSRKVGWLEKDIEDFIKTRPRGIGSQFSA